MITSLRLVNFKNFADETLRVGPFTVIVGANASGKSNIRDAFRFLHGIGRGYTLAEILGGKYGAGGQSDWEPIRGAQNEIVRMGPLSSHVPSAFSVSVELDLKAGKTFYSIDVGLDPVSPNGFHVLREKLRTESTVVYMTQEVDDPSHWLVVGKEHRQIGLSRSQPALTQIHQNYWEIWYQCISELGLLSVLRSIRFFDFAPSRIREPSFPGQNILGDRGENLPTVLEAICADPDCKRVLMSWVQELTPMDIEDFEFPRDPSGRVHLRILEKNGRSVSAYSVSDGTLRFVAMLAALLGDNPAGIYFFEEIDTGIHPNRLWLLVDLIERQTAKSGIQVITTTHSPDMLNFINDKTFESTSVVSRLEDTDDAIIRSVDSLPKAKRLRESYGLGRLHSTAWMETTLAFTEGYDDEDQAE